MAAVANADVLKLVTSNLVSESISSSLTLSIHHILIGAYTPMPESQLKHAIPPFILALLATPFNLLVTPDFVKYVLANRTVTSITCNNYIYLIDPEFANVQESQSLLMANIIATCSNLEKNNPITTTITSDSLYITYIEPVFNIQIIMTMKFIILPYMVTEHLLIGLVESYPLSASAHKCHKLLITYYDMSGQHYDCDPVITYMQNPAIFALSPDCLLDFTAPATCPLIHISSEPLICKLADRVAWYTLPNILSGEYIDPLSMYARHLYKYIYIDRIVAGLVYILPYLTNKTQYNISTGELFKMDMICIADDDNIAQYVVPIIKLRMQTHVLLSFVEWYMAVGRLRMPAAAAQYHSHHEKSHTLIEAINADIEYLTGLADVAIYKSRF